MIIVSKQIRTTMLLIFLLINLKYLIAQDGKKNSSFPNRLDIFEKIFFQNDPNYIFYTSGLLNYNSILKGSLENKTIYGFMWNHSMYRNKSALMIFTPKFRYSNKNYTIIIENSMINNEYNYEILSTKFSRNDISGDYNTALLKYVNNLENLSIAIGRSYLWWGQSMSSSLIINPNSGSFDNIYFTFNINNISKLESFTAQLDSKKLDNDIYNRYLTGHRLSILNTSKNLLINFGELFIYTGINQGIDLIYMNPIIPYYIVDINNDAVIKDNSNSLLFIDFRFKINQTYSIYGEFIIDDYQLDDTGVDNALGMKIGINYNKDIANRKLFFKLEKNIIDANTYSHHGNFSYFLFNDRPIGFNYGQGCNTTNAEIKYQMTEKLNCHFSILSLNKNNELKISDWSHNELSTIIVNNNTEETRMDKYLFYDIGIITQYKNAIINFGYSTFPIINQNIYGHLSTFSKSMYLDFILNFEWEH